MIVFILIVAAFIIILASVAFYGGNGVTMQVFASVSRFALSIFFIIFFPLVFLLVADPAENNCCGDTAVFSPDSKLTIYTLLGLSVISYFIAIYKRSIFTPIVEIILNTLLIIGLVLSIIIHIQILDEWSIFASAFCVPTTLFFIYALRKRHKLLIEYLEENEVKPENKYDKFAWYILTSDNKFIYFAILCLPLLFLIASALLLFGQKPDAMIRAFTDTYKHNFSQLDYMCENVECGGHYLCSVAANGHKDVVKPTRYGERLGRPIICNRQLLVSNAFEELVWQKTPRLHKLIRRNYDKVGDVVHKYYGIFNNKYVADIVYILMKPLEWIFLFTLYCFDKNPENRIAKQYLKKEDKESIKQ